MANISLISKHEFQVGMNSNLDELEKVYPIWRLTFAA
jgi:hypothetical protein